MSEQRLFILTSAANRLTAIRYDLEACAREHGGEYQRDIAALAERIAEIKGELKRLSGQ